MTNKGEFHVSRLACAAIAMTFVFALVFLLVRLFDVQVNDAADYTYASSRQSVRRVHLSGPRGRILDRHGAVLAENRHSFSIVCNAAGLQRRTWEATIDAIEHEITEVAKVIGVESQLTRRKISRHIRQELAIPLVVWRDVNDNVLSRFAEHSAEHPYFAIKESENRFYPGNSLAAHILGWVGDVKENFASGDEKFNFVDLEMLGRCGLEAYYDSFLKGVSGERKILVDARGFEVRSWMVTEPRNGPDLKLSIDAKIQREVERQLSGLKGACVVMDVHNGEVLAMASAPTYNLNGVRWERNLSVLNEDPNKPLLNRALCESYAPGSIFKPIVALAGLRIGYPEYEKYDCSGAFILGEASLRCTAIWGHGELDLRHALMKSCNPFFCNLALDIGTNAVITVAREFGLGSKTGIDFTSEVSGVVPDAEWKMQTYNERWYQGDLIQMSIGQGMLAVSPLQMAVAASALATGYIVTPHFKLGLPAARRKLQFSPEHLKVVQDGMRMVVQGDGKVKGTGWRAGEGVKVPVSGKTGTAEVGRGATRRKNTWFIAFAPSDNPTVAVAMIVENGESGGGTTAPKVGSVLKAVFNGR